MNLNTISIEVRHIDEHLPPVLSTDWYAKWKVRTVDVTCLSSPEGLLRTLTTEIFLVMVISSFVLQTSFWECLRLLKFCKISLQRSQEVDHWSVVLTGREYSPSLYIHLKSEDTKSIILPPFWGHFRPWESKKLPLCWEYFFRLHKKRKWKHNICTAKLGRLSGLEKNYWIWELLTYFILHRVNQPDKNKWIKCGLYFREAEYVISRISCNPPISL